LQFEVNGRAYFLTFVEDERRWYVFEPTTQGVHRIPVYIDGPGGNFAMMENGRPSFSN